MRLGKELGRKLRIGRLGRRDDKDLCTAYRSGRECDQRDAHFFLIRILLILLKEWYCLRRFVPQTSRGTTGSRLAKSRRVERRDVRGGLLAQRQRGCGTSCPGSCCQSLWAVASCDDHAVSHSAKQ
jgi:hypothetical protein